MYIWRKQATSDWVQRNVDELLARLGSAIAIVEQPGKARALVEGSCGRRMEAEQLQREFGGRIEKLRADWLQRFAKRNRVKPLRVGSRLVVSRSAESKSEGTRTIVIPAE